MRTVVRTKEGVLELNYMWLPTWIGMNATLKKSVEDKLTDRIVGMEMTEESLDLIDALVIDCLLSMVPHVDGLRDYLEGLKFIQIKPGDAANQG